MGKKENKLTNDRCLEIDPEIERLYRINCGAGQVGKMVRGDIAIRKILKKIRHIGNAAVLIIKPRPLQAAPAGWADLAGWETITITPEMVGTKIAQFKFIEVKATGVLNPDQVKMKDLALRMGCKFETLEPKDQ